MNLAAVKDLALNYSAEQLEECLSSELHDGHSACQLPDHLSPQESSAAQNFAIDHLAKAHVVREYMEVKQVSCTDALRELARRMRMLQEV
ncbi:MAG: hypothetical protein AB4040_08775 [Synechococcus sp.]